MGRYRKRIDYQPRDERLFWRVYLTGIAILTAALLLSSCVGPRELDPPGRAHDGRPVYPWMSTEDHH